MTTAIAIVLALLTPPTLYVASRIVFSAYFAAKRIYQRKLLDELAQGEFGWQEGQR